MRELVLAAGHFLLGPTNVLILTLPEGWRLATGQAQPEVDMTIERGGCRWMRRGRAWYHLWPEPRGPRLELTLAVGAAGPRPPDEPLEEDAFSAAGHQGRYAIGFRERRWPLPAHWPLLWARLDCEQTQRRLELEVTGPVGSGDLTHLRAFGAGLEGWRCH